MKLSADTLMRARTHSFIPKTAWRKHWQRMKPSRERLTS